jgi:hypothetical protein
MAIMLGMMIFLFFLGFDLTGTTQILTDTGMNLNYTNSSESTLDVASSSWFNKVFDITDGILALLAVGGAVIIGLFGKSIDFKIVFGVPFFTWFGIKFASVGLSMVNLIKTNVPDGSAGWLIAIVITVFGTLTAMFIFSVFEWFGGND